MILRLRTPFEYPERTARGERGFGHHFEQCGFTYVMGTGAGNQNSAGSKKPESTKIDIAIAAHCAFKMLP